MTVSQMFDSMSAAEFLLWQHYFKVDNEKWEKERKKIEGKNGVPDKPPPLTDEEENFVMDEEDKVQEQNVKAFLSRKKGIVQKRAF